MNDIQLAHLSFGGEGRDYNREHLVAIREARIATDYRSEQYNERYNDVRWAPVDPAPGLVSRLRLAIAGGPAISSDPSCCPA